MVKIGSRRSVIVQIIVHENCGSIKQLLWLHINFHVIIQHLAEALVPLSKEKEKLLQEHKDLKVKLEREFEQQSENKRSYQRDIEMLLALASKIEEYVF